MKWEKNKKAKIENELRTQMKNCVYKEWFEIKRYFCERKLLEVVSFFFFQYY